MLVGYRGEDLPDNTQWPGSRVNYLNEEQRQAYRLTVRDGRLVDASGVPFDTRVGVSLWEGTGRAIFVMDTDGTLYASNTHVRGQFHHSSFLAGAPVAAAGELVVIDGELQLLTDSSGHYQPERGHTLQAISRLRSLGIVLAPDRVRLEAPE